MKTTNKIELGKMLRKLDHNSSDVELMNEIALTYFENYDLKGDSEDYLFFKKAYETQKSVKTIHNFAWFLYFEWSELNYGWSRDNPDCVKAVEIQKQVLKHQPISFLPFYQLGYMLLEQRRTKESIPFLLQAEKLNDRKDISHNLGFAYFISKDFEKAYSKFKSIERKLDLENQSLFNLALCQLKLQLKDELITSLEILESTMENKVHKEIDGFDIARLYAANGNHQKCYDCVKVQGFDKIEITNWPLISYSIKKVNTNMWKDQIEKYLFARTQLIIEFASGNEEEDGYSKEERLERIKEIEEEIHFLKVIAKGNKITKPKINLDDLLVLMHCGCLLFGCKTHGNIENDS